MTISAADAIGPAFSRMKRICFQPFSLGKWFVIGFCAFLSTCGEGGPSFNGSNFRGSGSGGSGSGGPSAADIHRYISLYLPWIIVLAVVGFILIFAIGVAIMYLRCRGRFMFLDNIALNRAAVVEPWHRYGAQATSYFWFCLTMSLVSLAAMVLIGGLCMLLAMPDIRAGEISGMGIAAIVAGVLMIVPTGFVLLLIQSLAYNFVVPIMMIRNTTFRPAWNEAKSTVFRGHLGELVIFYLFRILFGLATGVMGMVAICATCCIGGLPYLSSVLLLPLIVFDRMFPLTFLEQFHPEYVLVRHSPLEPMGFPVVDEHEPPRML